MSQTPGTARAETPAIAVISREIVQIHARFYGRGPTRAKTIWRDEIIVCVLEDIFTKAERMMVDGGRFQMVRANRQAFQDEAAPLFRARQDLPKTTPTSIPQVIPIVRAPDDPGIDDEGTSDEFAEQLAPAKAQAGGWRGFLARWGS